MELPYRTTRRHIPDKNELLVHSPAEAMDIIQKAEEKLKTKLPKHERAQFLHVRAVLYEALGDKRMLETAWEAYNFSKTSQTTVVLAVALHYFGKYREAIKYYKEAYRYPHEPGFEIDIGYIQGLLFSGDPEEWKKAWPIVRKLKKRLVYALYLPEWEWEKNYKTASIISEGGFGDVIQNSRYLANLSEMGVKMTAYFPPYFFEHRFVDLAAKQDWFPPIKHFLEIPEKIPGIGFFDLPAIFNSVPDTVPQYKEVWKADPDKIKKYSYLRKGKKPKIGICWAARAMETPFMPETVYRSLSREQVSEIVESTEDRIQWVSLQHKADWHPGKYTETPELNSWEDHAGIIHNLDAVFSVDTANMHLACAMNKPTWVLLSGAVDWKFDINEKQTWYPTLRQIRNNDFGFENTVKKTIEELNKEEFYGQFNY